MEKDIARPLRVAIVHASDLGGGAERSVISLHRALRAMGHDSTVFVGERRTDEDGVVQIPYVRGIPGSRRVARTLERSFGWQDIYNPSFRALRTLLAGRFDVIHFNSLWGSAGFGDIAALPALTQDIPGVITMRDNWLLTGHCACFDDCNRWQTGCGSCPDLKRAPLIPRDGTSVNWIRKRTAVQNSRLHIVAVSNWLADQARASAILAGKQITRIYNGIDLTVFSPGSELNRSQLRREIGVDNGETVVLLAGQTVQGINGFQAPMHAMQILNSLPGQTKVRPLVIGEAAKQLASKIRLNAICLPFERNPERMASYYRLADITLVTSEAETFGRIAAESQACGTPVVAFDTGAIPEVVIDGLGGVVVRRADVAAAALAIETLSEDRPLRERMGKAGRAYSAKSFDSVDIADAYIALYQSIHTDFNHRRNP